MSSTLAANNQIMPAMVDFNCELPLSDASSWLKQSGIIAAINKTTQSAQQLRAKKTNSAKTPKLLDAAPLSVGGKGTAPSDLGAFATLGIRIAWAGACDLACPEQMLLALRQADKYSMLVIAEPNLSNFTPNAQMHQCAHSIRLGLAGHPPIAEHLAIHTLCELAQASGVHIHISSISSGRSVELIANAKARGNKITADVAISNLLYQADQIGLFDTSLKLWPPIREQADCRALKEGLNNGSIDNICSGHRNITYHHKYTSFAEAAFGNNQWITLYQNLAWLAESGSELNQGTLAQAINARPISLLGNYLTDEQKQQLSLPATVQIDKSTGQVQAMY